MLSISLSLQVTAIFEITVLSLIGISLPFLILRQSKSNKNKSQCAECEDEFDFEARKLVKGSFFSSMKSVSAGVMLGVAMVYIIKINKFKVF